MRGKRNPTWRGVDLTPKEQAAYTPGSTHTWAAFSSASSKKPFRGNTRFVIRGKHGKDVKAYSNSPDEHEVLLRAGTRVRVTREQQRRSGVLEIYVEEVDDGET